MQFVCFFLFIRSFFSPLSHFSFCTYNRLYNIARYANVVRVSVFFFMHNNEQLSDDVEIYICESGFVLFLLTSDESYDCDSIVKFIGSLVCIYSLEI